MESRDLETAQKMVEDVAKAAGCNVKAYHGTDQNFNTFRRGRHTNENIWGSGFYFAENEEEAYGWGERSMIANISDDYRVIPGYLSIHNPLELHGSDIFSGLEQETIEEVVKRLDPLLAVAKIQTFESHSQRTLYLVIRQHVANEGYGGPI